MLLFLRILKNKIFGVFFSSLVVIRSEKVPNLLVSLKINSGFFSFQTSHIQEGRWTSGIIRSRTKI